MQSVLSVFLFMYTLVVGLISGLWFSTRWICSLTTHRTEHQTGMNEISFLPRLASFILVALLKDYFVSNACIFSVLQFSFSIRQWEKFLLSKQITENNTSVLLKISRIEVPDSLGLLLHLWKKSPMVNNQQVYKKKNDFKFRKGHLFWLKKESRRKAILE